MPSEIDGLSPLYEVDLYRLRQENADLQEQIAREREAGSLQYQELRRRYEESREREIALDHQWSERYRNDVNRYEQRIAALEHEGQGLRQVLIALKTQLRADGRDKWRDAINSITRVLDVVETH